MKRVLISSYIRLTVLCVVLLSVVSLEAANIMTIRKGASTLTIEPSYLEPYSSIFPSDFNTIAFAEDGTPLMDSIYLFLPANLTAQPIPTGYVIAKTGNAYTIDLDDKTYRTTFVVGTATRTIENVDGKKLYFTGTCDDAFAGTAAETEGFIYIKGAKGENVDVYLDNCNIKTKSKTMPGQSINRWLKGYILGNASPIAIGSTSDDTKLPFTVNFHIRGNNKLTGGATSKLSNTDDDMNNMLADILYLSAAPIAIRPIPDLPAENATNTVITKGLELYRNIATKLTFDDVWPTAADGSTTIRTNGLLELPVEGDLGAPSIDLGNSKGQVEFNGGQYKFHTPRTNSMFYVSTMAICYRSIKLAGFETIGAGGSVSAGTASEESGTREIRDVVIKDGTFTTYPAEVVPVTPDDPTPVNVVQKGWYVENTDLRLPYNTRIMGGAFNNCKVYRCDGSGEQGVSPIQLDEGGNPVLDADGKEIPMCWEEMYVSGTPLLPNGVVDLTSGQIAEFHPYYGHASLTPIEEDGDKYVRVYLTSRCTDIVTTTYSRNWVTLIPKMGVEGFLTMGGDQTVYSKTIDGKKDLTNKYLFYARLNEYTKQNAFIELAGFQIQVQLAVEMITGKPHYSTYNPELEFSSVKNTDSYRIDNALYTMLSFPSNEWQLISLPYDVHRVYVMETTEKQFEGNPNNPEEIEAFLKEQGEADGKLAQNIVTSLCPDIFSGKGSGVNMNLIDIATKQIKCPPFELTHYNGKNGAESNASQAHYYLYEQVNEYDDDGYGGEDKLSSGIGLWRLETSVDQYSDKWKPAPTYSALKNADGSAYKDLDGNDAPPVLMQKGRIYSLFLPSGKDRYWDGKYLIFEGYGPQSVAGTSTHDNFLKYQELTTPDEVEGDEYEYGIEMLGLQGNITFANYKTTETTFLPAKDAPTESKGYWYHFDKTEPGAMIRPGQVYAGMSETATGNATALTPLGMIRRVDTTTDDARPVVGDILLYAYSQAGSLILDSHADQYVQVVSVDGRMIFADQLHDGEQKHIPATTGVYIVRSNEQVLKLMVER